MDVSQLRRLGVEADRFACSWLLLLRCLAWVAYLIVVPSRTCTRYHSASTAPDGLICQTWRHGDHGYFTAKCVPFTWATQLVLVIFPYCLHRMFFRKE